MSKHTPQETGDAIAQLGQIFIEYERLQAINRDLLAALKAAVAYLPRNNSAMHLFWREWLPQAESAIAKAEED